jgi:hypothetical protein
VDGRNVSLEARRHDKRTARGMSVWHDLVDWVGGYPFEVAKPEEVIGLVASRGFGLERLVTVGNLQGCNEFLSAGISESTDPLSAWVVPAIAIR